MFDAALPLNEWENFYVIIGSSAAGLTGLTFVVVALAADAHMLRLSGLRAFMTPTMVHFGSALWMAALLSVPGHTRLSFALSVGLSGLVGTAYSGATVRRMHRNRPDYEPVLSDWIWNATLPTVSYLALLAAALSVQSHSGIALYATGAVALLLLFIGIHNAWDIAVWITAERPSVRQPLEGARSAATDVLPAAVVMPSGAPDPDVQP